jgi:hypothetical protein
MACAEVADHQNWMVTELLGRLKAVAQDELARQRIAIQETKLALEESHAAIAQLTIEKEKLTKHLISDIVPDVIRGVRQAVVIKETRYNRNVEWARACGAVAAALGLVLFGYCWGVWSDWGLTARVESIGSAIDRCQATSGWADDKGQRLCELNDFLRR